MQTLTDIPAELRTSESKSPDRSRKLWIAMIWMLALMPILPIITTPRGFDAHYSNFVSGEAGQQGIVLWFMIRLTTYGLLGLSFYLIAKYRKRSQLERSEEARRLLLAVFLYSLAPILVTLVVSRANLGLVSFCLPVIFAATYYLPPIAPGDIARYVRVALASLYIYGSILAVIIAPDWAIESGYSTELSYTVIRLYGMAVHANVLAANLFMFIVLGWLPGAHLKMEKLHVFLALILMAASQSKAVFVIFLIVLFLKLSGSYIKKIYARKIARIFALLLLFGFAKVALSLVMQSKALLEVIQNPEVVTLTGRLQLWLITLNLWQDKPWFGYGADMWNAEMQMEYAPLMGGWLAPNAHNQFLQTLGESGVVGVGLLLIVYYVFGKAAWRHYSLTGGVSLFMFIYLVIRSLTEISIVLAATQSSFIIFWTIFALMISSYKYKEQWATINSTVGRHEK